MAEKEKTVRCTLRTVGDCSAFLARVIRQTYAGKLDSQEMSRYANAVQVLSRIIEGSDLEARILKLEAGGAK